MKISIKSTDVLEEKDGKFPVIGVQPKGKFIIKLQVPLGGDLSHAYVHNKDRTFEMFIPMSENIIELMLGQKKAFFKAHIDRKIGNLVVDEEIVDCDW